MRYDVEVVKVPEQALVVLPGRGTPDDRRRDAARLGALAGAAGLDPAGPPMTRMLSAEGADGGVAYEVCLPVAARADGSIPDRVGAARGELVPAHAVLRTVHRGQLDGLRLAWDAVEEARAALGYTASGPPTEVYVRDAGDASLTELRLPYAN